MRKTSTIYLGDLREKLEKEAKKENITISELVRFIIRLYYKEL